MPVAEGERNRLISVKHRKRRLCRSWTLSTVSLVLLLADAPQIEAVVVHGTVRDPLNQPIAGALVALVDNGHIVISERTGFDGNYQISTSNPGRFYILAGGRNFRQLATQSFFGGPLDSVERNITLEPDTVRESLTSVATGTPLPQSQVSASVTELYRTNFQHFQSVADALSAVPGFSLVQSGGRGGPVSLYVRGGDADANKILLDGVPMEDVGGSFDFANVSTTGIASAEAYRGPASVIYGADAASGVVSFATPQGSTPFPSLFYEGDGGNFGTFRNQVEAGGTRGKLDYYGAFADFQAANSLEHNNFHDVTSASNIGIALTTATHLRVTARNSDASLGSPGQYTFTQTPQDAKQGNQDLFLSSTLDHTFSDNWQAQITYGLARKRGRLQQFSPAGTLDPATGNYLGQQVTVAGANGYSVVGQAITSFAGAERFISDDASNRDSAYGQTIYTVTPHLFGVLGFRWENERGLAQGTGLSRTNYDSTFAVQGDFGGRFFYTLGGGAENNGLFGVVGEPHLGAAYYLVRPGRGLLHGTRVNFNFNRGYKEPSLPEQISSLQGFLLNNGGQEAVNQYAVKPLDAEQTRSYDGGFEQNIASERATLRVTYFHNQFTNGIESISPGMVPTLLPQLTAPQQALLAAYLQANSITGVDTNTLAFRAVGVETELSYSPKSNLFVRGGWTYLDTAVQHSLTADALGPSFNPGSSFANVPIGNVSPLLGARAFQRAPHTGFVSVTWTGKKWSGIASGTFASKSDDSTRLGGLDATGGNSLLLPNRNLDAGYSSLHAGGTYQWKNSIGFYTQLDNVLSQQHIAPIGSLSTPFTVRGGVRLSFGRNLK